MEIIIDDSSRLCEVQKKFSKHFPFLKLEFFELGSTSQKTFSKENRVTDTNKTIGEIRQEHSSGCISINGQQKVSTLEQNFREKFDIHIQVFRKSAEIWLQTTATDSWTLSEQNKKGEEMDHAVKEQAIEDYDQYHEQL